MGRAARLRVLFLINSLETGGAERQLALTVANLDTGRFEPVVCCLFRGGPYLEEVRAAGVEARAMDLPKSLRSALGGARRAVEDLRPHVVHTSMFEANVAGRLAARRASLPAVSHATNQYEIDVRAAVSPVPAWKFRLARSVERWSARRSGVRVVAVGRAVAASAARYLRIPAERVTVVRRGWDFSAMEAAAAPGLHAPAWPEGASPRLVTVGRIQPQKGLRYLIAALPEIRARLPRVHLAVAGEGPLLPELSALADRLGVGGAVSFLGVRRDVPALLQAAELFVFPSLWEGAAGAMVESLGLGLPVVATDVASLREIAEIAGGGVGFFPPGDPKGIARAVFEAAARLHEARDVAKAGIPRVQKAHDIGRNTRALESFYERLTARGVVRSGD